MESKSFILMLLVSAAVCYCFYAQHSVAGVSDLVQENIEALANNEGPTMLGCKPFDDATCYVFDGDGHLVDKRKNQYPGK